MNVRATLLSCLAFTFVFQCSAMGQVESLGCQLGSGKARFRASDHTLIVEAVMDNLVPILMQLDNDSFVREAQEPTEEEILGALLNLPTVDDYTKSRTQAVLECLPEVELYSQKIDPESRGIIEEILKRTSDKRTVIEVIDELHKTFPEREISEEQKIAIDITAIVITDGGKSIYWSRHTYYSNLTANEENERPSEHVMEVLSKDLEGVLVGAMGGCAAGMLAAGAGCGPPALAGAVAAGVGNSSKEVVVKVLRKLFK